MELYERLWRAIGRRAMGPCAVDNLVDAWMDWFRRTGR